MGSLFAREENDAARIDGLFSEAVVQLTDFPMLGHQSEVRGTRLFTLHNSYRLAYEVDGTTICVLTIIHTEREWPPLGG